MASAYWRTNHTVNSLLAQREVGWDFLQLTKLLLLMAANRGVAKDGASAAAINNSAINSGAINSTADEALLRQLSEAITFKSSLAADFPPGDIREVQALDQRFAVVLATGGLATQDGPLPEPFIEWVKTLSEQGSTAREDFLNLFSHRIASLRYMLARSSQPTLMDSEADTSQSGQLLYALSGVGYNRERQPADLRLAGLLANRRMSLPVIKQVLYFSLGLRLQAIYAYRGAWNWVDADDHSRLGRGESCRLGQAATLGKKVWNQQQAIELVFGPLAWSTIQKVIPGGEQHPQLRALLARISDCRCDCWVTLLVAIKELPALALGQAGLGGAALGLTTLLPVAAPRIDRQGPQKIRFLVKSSHYGRHYGRTVVRGSK